MIHTGSLCVFVEEELVYTDSHLIGQIKKLTVISAVTELTKPVVKELQLMFQLTLKTFLVQ